MSAIWNRINGYFEKREHILAFIDVYNTKLKEDCFQNLLPDPQKEPEKAEESYNERYRLTEEGMHLKEDSFIVQYFPEKIEKPAWSFWISYNPDSDEDAYDHYPCEIPLESIIKDFITKEPSAAIEVEYNRWFENCGDELYERYTYNIYTNDLILSVERKDTMTNKEYLCPHCGEDVESVYWDEMDDEFGAECPECGEYIDDRGAVDCWRLTKTKFKLSKEEWETVEESEETSAAWDRL